MATIIPRPIADPVPLHGLLKRVRDPGLPLVSIKRAECDKVDQTIPDARPRTIRRQRD